MSEGNPLERRDTGSGEHHIPGLPQINTYEEKIEKLRKLGDLIKEDEAFLDEKVKVDPKRGITPQMASKMLMDTMGRLAKNKKEYNKLMGISVQ